MDFKPHVDWEKWKSYLKQAVEFAEELGIPAEKIRFFAREAGEVLAQNVTPANAEQKTLRELWQVADNQEKQVLANLMTKLVSRAS